MLGGVYRVNDISAEEKTEEKSSRLQIENEHFHRQRSTQKKKKKG